MTHTDSQAGPDKVAPASLAQQRLWFLDHFTGGNSAYNLVSALRLRAVMPCVAGTIHLVRPLVPPSYRRTSRSRDRRAWDRSGACRCRR